MNDRLFDGRELKCYLWDGQSDYRMEAETAEQSKERIDQFGEWLEEKSD